MIRKHKNYSWENVNEQRYKDDDSFRSVTRRVLFENAPDIPCQWRYFEIGEGGYTTLEHHEHTHWVIIFRGKGSCLLGHSIYEVEVGDAITISSWEWHQFRANRGETLGFFCLVNVDRDAVTLPTDSDIRELKKTASVCRFLEGE